MGNVNHSCCAEDVRREEAARREEESQEEPRQVSSDLKRQAASSASRGSQGDRVGTPSISRAAVQAAAQRTCSMSSCASEEKPPQAKKMLQLPAGALAKEVYEIYPDSDSDDSVNFAPGDADSKSRTPKRRAWKRLSVCETMPVSPSSALQIVINNPGKLESFYTLDKGKILGKGSFGTVRRAYVSSTKAQRAVKFIAIARMKEKLNVLKQEIEIMKAVDHPNIAMLYEIFEDRQYLCLVMELCCGGTLLNRLKQTRHFTEEQTALSLKQILRAVFYLHRNWICHRDLKAENILLSTPEVLEKTLLKVSDFGLSCTFRPKQILTEKVGTLTHMAPEVLERRYTQSCDVWACGIIMYNLVSGTIPYFKEEEIKSGRLPFTKHWCDVSQDAVLLVKKLLSRQAHRPTAEHALQDSFILKFAPPNQESCVRLALLDELKIFRSQNKLKRASLTTIASLLADEHVKESRDLFIELDEDGDGQISVSEVEKLLRILKEQGQFDKDMNRREVERVFRDWDADKSGAQLKDFSYTEFLAATFDQKLCLTEAVCREAFNVLDKNKDDLLDLGELSTGRLLGHIDMEELRRTLEDLDQNGDHVLDFPEYMQMLRATATAKTPRSAKSVKSSRQPSFGFSR